MASSNGFHGFRHDPLTYIEAATTPAAAAVRKLVFDSPRSGDEALLESYVGPILDTQLPDGRLGDPHDQGLLASTGEALVRVLEAGASPERPEITRALDTLESAVAAQSGDEASCVHCYALHALCLAGRDDHPQMGPSLEKLALETLDDLGWGCPGTPMVQAMALWAGRGHADMAESLERILTWVDDAVEPPGCSAQLGLCEPQGLFKLVGSVEHPRCASITHQLVPMLLRSQGADGSLPLDVPTAVLAFQALQRYGLLEELRGRPPLPPDWRVRDELPCPARQPWGLLWDGSLLWVHERADDSAIAVSPATGQVVRRFALPQEREVYPLGLWDGDLTLTHNGDDRKLYRIDATSGQVRSVLPLDFMGYFTGAATQWRDQLLLGDHWNGGAELVDPADPQGQRQHLRLPGTPMSLAVCADEIWSADTWAPAVIHTNIDGELLAWAEKPFGNHCLAHDGERLWSIDGEARRICSLELA